MRQTISQLKNDINDCLIDIEILSKNIDSLLDLSDKIISKKIEISTDDNFGFMCLCFLPKQIEHMRSIRFLINAGQFSDTMIIARVMLEGLSILAWSFQDREKNALKWRSYSVVSDYKLYRKNRNEDISKEKELGIIKMVSDWGGDFLTKKSRKKLLESKPLPDFPYSYNWLINDEGEQIKISNIVREVDKQLYEFYADMSGWMHWDVGSIGKNIKQNKEVVELRANNPNDGAFSLATSYQSLSGMLEIVNHHLKLEFERQLENLKKKYISEISKVRKS